MNVPKPLPSNTSSSRATQEGTGMRLFKGLFKATIHITEAALDLPIALVSDVLTGGGVSTCKSKPYSVKVLSNLRNKLEQDAEEM